MQNRTLRNFLPASWVLLSTGILALGHIAAHANLTTVTLTNRTGQTADDLHLEFTPAASGVTSPSFTNPVSSGGGKTWHLDGGTVPNGGSAGVDWKGYGKLYEYYWTFGGDKIGQTVIMPFILNLELNPEGLLVISVENTGDTAIDYSELRIVTGANQGFYTSEAYIDGMETGQPVEAFIPSSGTFPPGVTLVTQFEGAPLGYTAISVLAEGDLFALGSSPVRPDVTVGPSLSRQTSPGVYSPTMQRSTILSRDARPVRGFATVSNLGALQERLAVRATRGNRLFRVVYHGASGNLSAALVSGAYRTAMLDEATPAQWIRATVTPNRRRLLRSGNRSAAVPRRAYQTTIRAASTSSPSINDAAILRVRTVRRRL